MQLPVKVHYATLALLAMAKVHGSGQRIGAKAIAEQHGIPTQFLIQILQQLRAAGLIHGVRGAQGGFCLARSPASITLLDVVEAICPADNQPAAPSASDPLAAAAQEVWCELAAQQRALLESRTLAQLVERSQSAGQMFYI
ncbi:MAG: Rrf2 family transcriptional regulator [Planctomycetota bacterium]|nr:MAG: Rrf2 family transcriptional regulator [Planctomycetota bacterium]